MNNNNENNNNNNNNNNKDPYNKASPYYNKGVAVAFTSLLSNISLYLPLLRLGTSAEHCYIGMTFFLLLLADSNHHSII